MAKIRQNVLNRFFSFYDKKNTIRLYKRAISLFLQNIYGDDCNVEKSADKYINSDRDNELDLANYVSFLNEKYSPKTVASYRHAVTAFLYDNDIQISKRVLKRIARQNKTYTITNDKPPAKEQIRKILRYLPLKGKALFLSMLSSGMRIVEALKIELEDIDWESVPLKIQLKGNYTKSRKPRIIFVSNEAKETILQWLDYREEYMEFASTKNFQPSKRKELLYEKRLFPFSRPTASSMWRRALKKAGLSKRNKETGFFIHRPHTLRKYFRTYHGAPVEIKEVIMGHEGYLTGSYVRYAVEELREAYEKGMYGVEVFTDSLEMNTLKERIKQLEEQQKSLSSKVRGMFEEDPNANVEMAKFFVWWNEIFSRRVDTSVNEEQLDNIIKILNIN
jgi:integrase